MPAFATPSAADLTDPVTGQAIELKVNYSSSETAMGYDFLGETTTLKGISTFNLDVDVDGDGKVTAFYDDLTNKAISADATRTTDEIHE